MCSALKWSWQLRDKWSTRCLQTDRSDWGHIMSLCHEQRHLKLQKKTFSMRALPFNLPDTAQIFV